MLICLTYNDRRCFPMPYRYNNDALPHFKNTTVPFRICTFRASLSTNLCKVHPITCHEDKEFDQRFSSTLSLTSALDWGDGQHHAPAALSQGKTRYPLYRKLGGLPMAGLDGCGKSRPPVRFDPRTVTRVASRYTD
jgi:hypothetical protein